MYVIVLVGGCAVGGVGGTRRDTTGANAVASLALWSRRLWLCRVKAESWRRQLPKLSCFVTSRKRRLNRGFESG
jgi:hypothetical protein